MGPFKEQVALDTLYFDGVQHAEITPAAGVREGELLP